MCFLDKVMAVIDSERFRDILDILKMACAHVAGIKSTQGPQKPLHLALVIVRGFLGVVRRHCVQERPRAPSK